MSLEAKVMPSVSSMMDFIKSQVKNSLIEANTKKIIEIDRNELEKISSIVEASIEHAYGRGMNEVINALGKIKS